MEKKKKLLRHKGYLSLEAAADYLSYTKSSLYQFTSKRKIPHYKFERKILFKVSELDDFIEKHRVAPKSEIKQQAIDFHLSKKY
jgi:excisionase family DNA binding protein